MSSFESVARSPGTARLEEVPAPSDAQAKTASPRWPLWLPVLTLVIGLAVTGALVLVSHSQYTNNEKRLLRLRVRDAAALLAESLPGKETPLASAAELADATNGNVEKFMRFAAPLVAEHQFASISLWRAAAPEAGPVAVAGVAPKLASTPAQARVFIARASRARALSMTGLLQPPDPRVGYAYAAGAPGGYVAYGENPLPANRRSKYQSTSAFTGLDYAIFLGATQAPRALLVSDRGHFPLPQPSDAETVPFGERSLTLVMSSRVPLAGSLPERLPWIIAILGVFLSTAAAVMTWRLTQRRRDAESLAGELEVSAGENRRLYAEQRGIAQTLQHALLPDKLPQIPGMVASARYEAGEHGVDIGGDWYDVIELENGRMLLVVGDVSGRGLDAATTMAELRYAIRAYAAQGDPPAAILTKLSDLVDVAESGHLATVLFALVDVEAHEIGVTSAGHLPPLLISNDDSVYVDAEIGVPIGVESGASYHRAHG